jgi:hypothetical protein
MVKSAIILLEVWHKVCFSFAAFLGLNQDYVEDKVEDKPLLSCFVFIASGLVHHKYQPNLYS